MRGSRQQNTLERTNERPIERPDDDRATGGTIANDRPAPSSEKPSTEVEGRSQSETSRSGCSLSVIPPHLALGLRPSLNEASSGILMFWLLIVLDVA